MGNFFDIENEILCVGAAIYKKDHLIKLLELEEIDFYDNRCRNVFKIIAQLHNDSGSVDLPNIKLKIKEHNYKIDDFFLASLLNQPTVFNIEILVKKIKDLSDKRKIENISLKIKDTNLNNSKELVINNIYNWIREIEESNLSNNNFIGDLVNVDISEFGLKITDYSKSHIQALNKKVFGHIYGDLSILAGRPGQGKTTFSLEEAVFISEYEHVDFFTLEMSKKQLALKVLACVSGVNSNKIRSGNLEQVDLEKLIKAINRLKKRKLNIIDKCRNLSHIINRIRQNNIKFGTKVVVIDYLQLIKVEGSQERRLKIAEATRELKALAVDLNICIILLSQLNRLAQDKVPTLADLSESGAIEQDADNVYFIYTSKDEGEMETTNFIIAKARMGEIGFIRLYFNKKLSSFTELFIENA